MKILTPEKTGFCFGVNRAIKLTEEVLSRKKPTYIMGELIHNDVVTRRLSRKGLKQIGDIGRLKNGILVIRAHGMAPGVRSRIEEKKIEIVDATCPIVRQAQLAAKRLEEEGYQVVIVGDKEHAEIKGIVGHLRRGAIVVASPKDIDPAALKRRVGVIFQTTHSVEFCKDIVAELMKTASDIKIINTICGHIRRRQEEAVDIARRSDIVVVVGSRHSSNTLKLMKLCHSYNRNTIQIETAGEIKPSMFRRAKTAGIVGGASTPDFLIEEVKRKLASGVSK